MTPDTLTTVSPNKPKTPLRSFRYPDVKWKRAREVAAAKGMTVTDVIVQALDELIEDDGEEPAGD